jgi:hypothetical protein
MNIKLHRKNFFRRAQIIIVLLVGIFPAVRSPAQRAERAEPGRFLFIFDTSLAMKSRVEVTQNAVQAMLMTSMRGHLHAGDSIGVWTLGQELAAGNYPLQIWNPDKASLITSNLMTVIRSQHYAKTANFAALPPLLNEVVKGSEQLTVLVFCDGSEKVTGTPFDAAMNQLIQEKLAAQTQAHAPFIILLRSQQGKYIGGTVSFPPAPLNIVEFPPLPAPTPPAPPPTPRKPTNLPPPVVIVTPVPPLFITGTTVSTGQPPTEIISPPANESAPPAVASPPVAPVQPTNLPPPPPTNPAVAIILPPTPTNAPAGKLEHSVDDGNKNFLTVGAGLLGAVILLGMLVRLRSHRRETSLITRSMNHRR